MSAETNGGTGRVRIELYVRSFYSTGAQECQERTINRLNRLVENDVISDASVTVWGRRFGVDTAAARTEQGRHMYERILEFEQWAQQADASLQSLERIYSRNPGTEEGPDRVINFPVMFLVEYVDDDVVHVAPCSADGTVERVEDRLARLESQGRSTASADIHSRAVRPGGESR